MKSNEINNSYRSVNITLRISAETNQLLTESSLRSKRTKNKEALIRIENSLEQIRSLSEKSHAVLID